MGLFDNETNGQKVRVTFPLKRPEPIQNLLVHIQAVPIGWNAKTKLWIPENTVGVPVITTAGANGTMTSLPDYSSKEFKDNDNLRDIRLKAISVAQALDWHEDQKLKVDWRAAMKLGQKAREQAADDLLEIFSKVFNGGELSRVWEAVMTISNVVDLWGELGSDFLPYPPKEAAPSQDQSNTISERKSKPAQESASI